MALTLSGDDGVAGVNGSATTPALQGTDTNTGISFGTDTVNVVTGGSTRATVDSDGDFGIGTTSPSALLHIAKSGGNAKLLVQRSNTAANTDDYGSIVWQSSAGNNNALIGAARHSAENDAYMFFSTASGGTLQEVGRFTHDGDLRFNSGYGSVATAYGVRAWINFDGTAATIGTGRGSRNMDAVTDGGNGVYTVNFTNDMPDNNYAILTGTHDYTTFGVHDSDSPTAGSVKFVSRNPGSAGSLERYYYAVAIVR